GRTVHRRRRPREVPDARVHRPRAGHLDRAAAGHRGMGGRRRRPGQAPARRPAAARRGRDHGPGPVRGAPAHRRAVHRGQGLDRRVRRAGVRRPRRGGRDRGPAPDGAVRAAGAAPVLAAGPRGL
ncbi:MAG: hypothetical protein AVDCRST_MAG41-3125, partial [uncultured Corynebacteriales bacterium]